MKIEVEVFSEEQVESGEVQSLILVNGIDDVYWLDTPSQAIQVINDDLKKLVDRGN